MLLNFQLLSAVLQFIIFSLLYLPLLLPPLLLFACRPSALGQNKLDAAV